MSTADKALHRLSNTPPMLLKYSMMSRSLAQKAMLATYNVQWVSGWMVSGCARSAGKQGRCETPLAGVACACLATTDVLSKSVISVHDVACCIEDLLTSRGADVSPICMSSDVSEGTGTSKPEMFACEGFATDDGCANGVLFGIGMYAPGAGIFTGGSAVPPLTMYWSQSMCRDDAPGASTDLHRRIAIVAFLAHAEESRCARNVRRAG